ncbi:MAG: TrmH family RNA methyltransferase [bacterium]
MDKKENILIIDNIRSVENVGAMFRTADAAGIDKIYLTGITPAPIDRFGRKRKDLAKSALGAEDFVPWEQVENSIELITQLKKEGYFIVGIEQDKKSIDYTELKIKNKNAFIVGAEVTGIPKEVLKECDAIIEILMRGKKESLNVSVALGVVLFRLI